MFIKIYFVEYFGLNPDSERFRITYQYSSEKQLKINNLFINSEDNLDIKLSFSLEKKLILLIREIREILNYRIISKEQQNKFQSLEESRKLESTRRLQVKNFKSRIDSFFEETHYPVFIPAGRSLMSTFIDQLQDIKYPDTLDYFTKFLVERINLLKSYFTDDVNTFIQNKDVASDIGIDKSILLKIILKGEYRFNADIDKERIFLINNQYVKLQDASSGQQESVLIFLLIYC
jgi:hypothetical protein